MCSGKYEPAASAGKDLQIKFEIKEASSVFTRELVDHFKLEWKYFRRDS